MTSKSQHLPSAAHHEACDELRHQGQTNQELAVLAVSSGVFYGFPLWLYHINRVVISKTNKKTSIDESISSKNIHDSNWILPKRTWHWKKTLQAFVALNHSIACGKNQAFELGCGPAATETLGCVPSWEQRCESQGFKCCTKSQSPSFFSSHGAE